MARSANADSMYLSPGSPVLDSTGKQVGTLAESRESYFKVERSWAPDYWLPRHLVDHVDGDVVTLTLPEDDLDAEKIDAAMEDMTMTEIEESTDDTLNPLPVERRYEAESEYLKHPHQF